MNQNDFLMLANTLGTSILVETIRLAAYYAVHSNSLSHERKTVTKIMEGSACFIFIQGTGLDNLISSYCMDYDSNKIREGFQYCLRRRFHL